MARTLECCFLGDVLNQRDCECPGKWLRECDLFGRCTLGDPASGEPTCASCEYYSQEPADPPRRIVLANNLCPGDCLAMTAAIHCLHEQHPRKFLTAVQTSAPAIFEHNPHVCWPASLDGWERIETHYPLVNRSNQEPVHFLQGYVEYLAEALGVPLRLTMNRPHLYLTNEEKAWLSQVEEITKRKTRYWIVNAGCKTDYTAKFWGTERYQRVIDMFAGKVVFIQVGEGGHVHPPLHGVINLVGKTDLRQLIRLCWHADGGIGPTTLLQHIMAAFEKPYVCILGGREPVSWVQYPRQTTLHTVGALECCKQQACWKSRVVPLGDGNDRPESLCVQPVPGDVPRCMALIQPADVVAAIERYHAGGALSYA